MHRAVQCAVCAAPLRSGARLDCRYCGVRCRVRAHRIRCREAPPSLVEPVVPVVPATTMTAPAAVPAPGLQARLREAEERAEHLDQQERALRVGKAALQQLLAGTSRRVNRLNDSLRLAQLELAAKEKELDAAHDLALELKGRLDELRRVLAKRDAPPPLVSPAQVAQLSKAPAGKPDAAPVPTQPKPATTQPPASAKPATTQPPASAKPATAQPPAPAKPATAQESAPKRRPPSPDLPVPVRRVGGAPRRPMGPV